MPNYVTQTVKVGDRVCFSGYSDMYPGTVIKRTVNTLTVREDIGHLLNGPSSGEEDALTVTPGGFCAHVEGRQRYQFEENPGGRLIKFTWRKPIGKWVQSGIDKNANCGKLYKGWHKHHDYNF